MGLIWLQKLATGFLLIVAVCTVPLFAAQVEPRATRPSMVERLSAWKFREDFSNGIPRWMSFPLAQDVGYDPSIYTAQRSGTPVLVRDVIADGQRELRVGMVRPLEFRASAASVVRLAYKLESTGVAQTTLTLGSVSGRRYTTVLAPPTGRLPVQVSGQKLGIPAGGDDIEVIVIEARVDRPVEGSHSRLILSTFEIDALQRAALTLLLPHLTRSEGMQVAVADEVSFAEKPLQIHTAAPQRAATLRLFDGSGKETSQSSFTGSLTPDRSLGSAGLWRAVIESGGSRTEFRFLVLGRAPAHPRVLLKAARITELKADAPLCDRLHRKAEQTAAATVFNPWAGENIQRLSRISVFLGLPQYFTLMESYSNTASLGALDYVLNQNSQGLERARKVLLESAGWPSWTPPWFAAQGLHTYYETGLFSQRLALAYDLIADQLSAQEKSRIAAGFLRNAIDPAIHEYFLNDRMPIAASNHAAHAVGGAIADCVALEGDVPEWDKRFAPRLAQLIVSYERLMNGLFPGDGSEAEPAGYEDFAMEGMSWGGAALDSLGIHSARMDVMLQAFWWEKYIRIRPDLLLDTGDFHGELSSLPGFAWAAEYAHDPSLRAFYEDDNDRTVMAVSRSQHYEGASDTVPGLLDLVCCTKPLSTPPIATPSRVFPLRGSAVLRSGWNKDDTVISLRAGAWFNHEHHDQGSFQVAAFGEKLIAEAGYSDYYKDPKYADYFTQAAGHNTVLLDHNPFSQGDYDGRYWTAFRSHPSIDRHFFSQNIDYLVANLSAAYKRQLQQFTREYLFLKPGILIIRDRLSSAQPHQYSWLLHAPAGTETSVDKARATISGNHGAATITTPNGEWSIASQPIPITAYGEFEKGRIFPRSAFVLDTPKQPSHTFLVGMQFVKVPASESFVNWKNANNRVDFDARDGEEEIRGSFRKAPGGELSAGQFTTDGDSLAISQRGTQSDVLITQARNLRGTGTQLIATTSAVDLMLHQAENGLREFHLACRTDTTVKLASSKAASAILMDGKPVTAEYRNGTIALELAEGEHVVILQP